MNQSNGLVGEQLGNKIRVFLLYIEELYTSCKEESVDNKCIFHNLLWFIVLYLLKSNCFAIHARLLLENTTTIFVDLMPQKRLKPSLIQSIALLAMIQFACATIHQIALPTSNRRFFSTLLQKLLSLSLSTEYSWTTMDSCNVF